MDRYEGILLCGLRLEAWYTYYHKTNPSGYAKRSRGLFCFVVDDVKSGTTEV